MSRASGNLAGQRFGYLVAQERVPSGGDHAMWLCLCDCGKTSIVRARDMRCGHTTSCGCKRGGAWTPAPAVDSEKTWKGAEDASATLSALWGMQ